ncbi:MAG TPA: aldehyde dehydrogenase (NADP(+)) [Bacteroidota bacterium]|nr:aldehyde dehydrogenase (NADP(+)) [Bacteroidota bacterium]
MDLTGYNFIGKELSGKGSATFQAVNPADGSAMAPPFHEATQQEIDAAVRKAEEAFQGYSNKSGKERAVFLEAIADAIQNLGDSLIKRCCSETGLPESRIIGERGRTVGQLKLFAGLLMEGSWVDARIDIAPPKPDIRSMQKALGPVGVFGASNFPLAFSVAGGDTTAALAAGCPIVVKAHPAHPGTCEMIAHAIRTAVERSGMPDGTFSMVHGQSADVGMAIVLHPLIKAIGFTGSYKGGKAIFDAAMKRSEPIPVYSEMGSANPVFILPGALRTFNEEIAKGLTASVTLGVGQYCTNPGLFFYEKNADGEKLQKLLGQNFSSIESAPMLTKGIYLNYSGAVDRMNKQSGVKMVSRGKSGSGELQGTASLMETSLADFLRNGEFENEIFGPSTLAVCVNEKSDYLRAAQALHGHLTATLWGTDEDLAEYQELVHILERKVGRLIVNGFPTGVDVCHSMVHGGPFPATTDSRSTSVGTLSIYRFTRPVCYQNFPIGRLPDELKNENPLGIWRLVNGTRTNADYIQKK